jgi:hypothetical protein
MQRTPLSGAIKLPYGVDKATVQSINPILLLRFDACINSKVIDGTTRGKRVAM